MGYARLRLMGSGEVTGCEYAIPLQGEKRDQAPCFPEGALRSVTAGSQGVQTPLDQAMPGDPQSRVHQGCRGPYIAMGQPTLGTSRSPACANQMGMR